MERLGHRPSLSPPNADPPPMDASGGTLSQQDNAPEGGLSKIHCDLSFFPLITSKLHIFVMPQCDVVRKMNIESRDENGEENNFNTQLGEQPLISNNMQFPLGSDIKQTLY